MLRWSIGANSPDAGNIRVFDTSGYSTRDFPVTLRCTPGLSFLSPPPPLPIHHFHVWICAFVLSRRMFRFIHARACHCFQCSSSTNPCRSAHCLRMKNPVNLEETVILHADENPRDASFSAMTMPNVIKTDQ